MYIYIYTRVYVCVRADINSHSIINPKPTKWLLCPNTCMMSHISARRNTVSWACSAQCLTTRRNINGTWNLRRPDWLSGDVFVSFLCKAYVKWNAVDRPIPELIPNARNIPPPKATKYDVYVFYWSCIQICLLVLALFSTLTAICTTLCDTLIQWRTQEFFSGGGFNKFNWGQRTDRTGIWGW